MKRWFTYHSVWQHLAAPIWTRIPEKHRWTIVHWLDRSRRRCWSNLVSDALTERQDDACDTPVPSLRGDRGMDCATTCYWMGGHVAHDHEGEHDCNCYCGKFQFRAAEGYDDRRKEAGQADASLLIALGCVLGMAAILIGAWIGTLR